MATNEKMNTKWHSNTFTACYIACSYHCENNLWPRQIWWCESSSFWTSVLCFI